MGAFEQRTAVAASHWDVMVPCCTAAICSKCLGFEGTGGVQVEGVGDGSLVSAENPPNVGTCSPSRLRVAQEYVPVSKRFHWALVALLANRCRSGFSGGVSPAPRERRRSSCEVQGEHWRSSGRAGTPWMLWDPCSPEREPQNIHKGDGWLHIWVGIKGMKVWLGMTGMIEWFTMVHFYTWDLRS